MGGNHSRHNQNGVHHRHMHNPCHPQKKRNSTMPAIPGPTLSAEDLVQQQLSRTSLSDVAPGPFGAPGETLGNRSEHACNTRHQPLVLGSVNIKYVYATWSFDLADLADIDPKDGPAPAATVAGDAALPQDAAASTSDQDPAPAAATYTLQHPGHSFSDPEGLNTSCDSCWSDVNAAHELGGVTAAPGRSSDNRLFCSPLFEVSAGVTQTAVGYGLAPDNSSSTPTKWRFLMLLSGSQARLWLQLVGGAGPQLGVNWSGGVSVLLDGHTHMALTGVGGIVGAHSSRWRIPGSLNLQKYMHQAQAPTSTPVVHSHVLSLPSSSTQSPAGEEAAAGGNGAADFSSASGDTNRIDICSHPAGDDTACTAEWPSGAAPQPPPSASNCKAAGGSSVAARAAVPPASAFDAASGQAAVKAQGNSADTPAGTGGTTAEAHKAIQVRSAAANTLDQLGRARPDAAVASASQQQMKQQLEPAASARSFGEVRRLLVASVAFDELLLVPVAAVPRVHSQQQQQQQQQQARAQARDAGDGIAGTNNSSVASAALKLNGISTGARCDNAPTDTSSSTGSTKGHSAVAAIIHQLSQQQELPHDIHSHGISTTNWQEQQGTQSTMATAHTSPTPAASAIAATLGAATLQLKAPVSDPSAAAAATPAPDASLDWAAAVKQQDVRVWELSSSPRLLVVDGVLPAAACQQLIQLAEPNMIRSRVASGSTTPSRTSWSYFFTRGGERHPLVQALEQVVTSLFKDRLVLGPRPPLTKTEALQVVHYHPGEYYQEHYDNKSGAPLSRTATIIIYLCDTEGGGGTHFPEARHNGPAFAATAAAHATATATAHSGSSSSQSSASAGQHPQQLAAQPLPAGVVLDSGGRGIHVLPRTGRAVLFWSAQADGTEDVASLHAAEAVLAGHKWIATRWMGLADK